MDPTGRNIQQLLLSDNTENPNMKYWGSFLFPHWQQNRLQEPSNPPKVITRLPKPSKLSATNNQQRWLRNLTPDSMSRR